jgi:hypothetical protein
MPTYYLYRAGQQLGPFSELELRNMLSTGQAALTDSACIVGANQWQPINTLPAFAVTRSTGSDDSPVATVIPYKNPPALIGYYLGVFSLIPCVGFLLGIPALILGIIGLKKANAAPGSKGKAHAWTAISLGSIAILLWGAAGVLVLVGSMQRH